MGSLGPFEIILIFLVILLIFGAKRIPEIARGLGKGIREFKDATNEIQRELNVNDHSGRIQPPQQQPTPRQQSSQHAPAEPPQPARSDNPGSQETSQQQAS
jgi:sec-independent protein translocase protein TatA